MNESKNSIKKPFFEFIQDHLYLFAERFNKSTTEVVFLFLLTLISVFFPILLKFFPECLISIFIVLFGSLCFLVYGFRSLIIHNTKIKKLQQKHNKYTNLPSTGIRILLVILFTVLSLVFFWFIYENPYEWEILKNITIGVKSIISITTLIITAPIAFIIWAFRDKNKLLELENARKDTNLKEFQQLQRWATGNIEGDKDNQDNKIALQISALHSLRAYLKGEYGDSFRRGAYEIFRASLATQHQKILKQVNEGEFENITIAINSCQLTKQLNIIASEEWFNLLINHNFPTNNISLLGVNLSKTYLHHCTYGKTLDLGGAQLQKANLRDAQLQGACLNNARLQGACLNNARLQGADLRGAQLQGANLSNAQLQGADLREAQLQGAGLVCAQLQGVDLLNARLQGADLRFAQLQGANLRFAQLQGACLNNARLQKANLRDAQLQGADLREAQLQGANLNNARLQGAHTNVHYVDFKQRIEQQIDQDTTKEIRGLMYKALDDTQKSQLIAELKAVSSMCATEAIERIKSASETLDLSGASTGKYSQQDADEWLNCYHEAMKK